MSTWNQEEMLELFGQVYEVMEQKTFDAARKAGRHDFGVCLFENVDLQGLRIADGNYDFSTCRFFDCRFTDCFLDGVLFENTVFRDCEFNHVEALSASFADARIFDTRFRDIAFHDFDAKGSSWRHGFMHNALLAHADLRAKLMDSFTFQNVRVARCNPPSAEAITMGGATEGEVSHYRNSVLSGLSARNDMALLDDLTESRNRIYSAIYYLSSERVSELADLANNETSDPETQEWRSQLVWNEQLLVGRWDGEYERGVQKIAESFRAARESSARAATLPNNISVLAKQGDFVLVQFNGSKDFYGFGSRRDGFSFPANQCGTKAEVMAELARWQAEVDFSNPAMQSVEQAFIAVLEKEPSPAQPSKLDAICQDAISRAAEINAAASGKSLLRQPEQG